MVWCSHCFNDCLTEFDPKNGYISCADCGKILDDVEYYDGQDEGDAPFSAKDTSDTGGYESWNSEGSKGPGEGPEITRYQADDRSDYGKTHVLSDTSSDEEDNLSDIDDAEVNGYLHNEKEMCYKTMIWEAMNKEYLQEKATKVAVTAVAKRSDASNFLTKERKRRGSDIAPGQSASEATDKVVDRKRQSSKINYEALNKLIPAGVEKKPRTEAYTVGADGIQPVEVEKKPETEAYTVDADGIQTALKGSYTLDADGIQTALKGSYTLDADGIQPTKVEKKPGTESYTVDADGIQTAMKGSYTVYADGIQPAKVEKKPGTESYTVDVDCIQTGIEANENVFYSAGEGDEAVNYEDDDYGHYWDPH